uniref:Uncharacterized protein n=1 Tax=Candidatus Kentrum sp. UNK TaxID=2126344 RepID=A0A451ATU2_9GAMM|nr:MAG: hypothetical protein BECKUNK1418G_GA0071005_101319 [Candidatus Kentron sp. UNK]VFK69464.1 MAG: hypothetical protein BECKUNK1418H_GA0071006_101419 [Candidatus Kentron sp. UNK]
MSSKAIVAVAFVMVLDACVFSVVYGWQEVSPVPPRHLPSLDTSDPGESISRLKQYVTTGEKMADQFQGLLSDYRNLTSRYVEFISGCLNEEVFDTPLFRDAYQYSVCNPRNRHKLRSELRQQANRLDALESELTIIKLKVERASKRVAQVLQFQELQANIRKMNRDIEEAEDIEAELRRLESKR